MRTKTKNKKLNDQRIEQMNKQNGKSVQNVRKKVQKYDLEKAAIIYFHLFMDTKDVKKIDYSTFYKTWIKWFPADAYGCSKIIKQSFSKTVQCAGSTEESIRAYRDSVKIFTMDMVTSDDMRELKELATKKGCSIKRSKDFEQYLSGFCIKKITPPNYQFRKSNIILGEKYESSYESAKKYLLNLPDINDLRLAQDQLKNILSTDTTINEKIDAIQKFPYYVATYDFDLYLDRFVRRCDSWRVLNAALQLCDRLHVLNTMTEKPLDVKANRNASKSLEQLGLFNSDRITKKVIASCIRNSGISTDCTEWTEEDFNKFTNEISSNHSAKYQYIRDRYPKLIDYKLWILSKHTGKGYKILEKEMKDFLKGRK
ncbi:MAG: hypothetical protein NC412_05310 [Roseburia sp.]|nr:hypothetical protein [Roseburia sp.]